MKITQARQDGVNVIRRYGADFIVVGEQEIRASCIISATTLTRDWRPKSVS